MLLTIPRQETKEFITKLAIADVVRVNDDLFIIASKADWADQNKFPDRKIEDFEVVFETDYHQFTWWEISNELTIIDAQRYKVGDTVIAFLGLITV